MKPRRTSSFTLTAFVLIAVSGLAVHRLQVPLSATFTATKVKNDVYALPPPEQLVVIRAALQTMEVSTSIGEWVEADLAFHTAILKATNNPLLMPLAAIIGSALESLLDITARNAGDFKNALPEHQKVFAAIEEGDSQDALHRMAGMLSDTRALMKRSVLF